MWQSMHQIGRFFLGTQMRQDVFGIRSKENSCVTENSVASCEAPARPLIQTLSAPRRLSFKILICRPPNFSGCASASAIPCVDVFVVQETLLKALMSQPGIGQRHSSNTHIFTHPSTSHRLCLDRLIFSHAKRGR